MGRAVGASGAGDTGVPIRWAGPVPAASLQALLALRQQHGGDAPSPVAALRAQMTAQSTVETAFSEVRRTLWGDAVCQDQGRQLMARAPEALRPFYAQIFAPAAGRLPG